MQMKCDFSVMPTLHFCRWPVVIDNQYFTVFCDLQSVGPYYTHGRINLYRKLWAVNVHYAFAPHYYSTQNNDIII